MSPNSASSALQCAKRLQMDSKYDAMHSSAPYNKACCYSILRPSPACQAVALAAIAYPLLRCSAKH